MADRKWFNQSLPQTLQIAVMLLYLNGVFFGLSILTSNDLDFLSVWGIFLVAVVVGHFVAGTGIATEQRFAYLLGFAVAIVDAVFSLMIGALISVLFDVALIALLAHPQSQEYQRIWFR